MSNPSFESILDKPGTDVERPKPLPIGTYLTTIVGLPRYDKSSKKQTPFIEFTHQLVAAMDDVDVEELAASGGLHTADGTPRVIKNTYYLTEAAGWMLRKFLEDVGYDFSDGELTMRAAAEDTANREVYILIRHEPSQDGKSVFARIGDTAIVE